MTLAISGVARLRKCDGRAQHNPMYTFYTCQVLSHGQFNIIIHIILIQRKSSL